MPTATDSVRICKINIGSDCRIELKLFEVGSSHFTLSIPKGLACVSRGRNQSNTSIHLLVPLRDAAPVVFRGVSLAVMRKIGPEGCIAEKF